MRQKKRSYKMKKWYQSKTLWVGAVEIIGSACGLLVGEGLVTAATTAAICGVLTIALRLVTDKGIIR